MVGGNRCEVNRNTIVAGGELEGEKGRQEKWTLSDSRVLGGDEEKLQCFRVRAGVFASAHGRPDGMPGRSIGARAKTLRGRKGSGGLQ